MKAIPGLALVVVLSGGGCSSTSAVPVVIMPDPPEEEVTCHDLLDSLSPKEAADCMQPDIKKVVVLVQDPAPIDEEGRFVDTGQGQIQLLIFIGKKGEIVSYNREEFLASPALQLLLKRLEKLHKVDKEWFIPTTPVDGTCT